jgi:uncharacterized membrane protein YtjA (UPF0391 family)
MKLQRSWTFINLTIIIALIGLTGVAGSATWVVQIASASCLFAALLSVIYDKEQSGTAS